MNIITIDPGCRKSGGGTGIAVFVNNSSQCRPVRTKCFTCDCSLFSDRSQNIKHDIIHWLVNLGFTGYRDFDVHIEEPQFFGTSKGLTTAASGSLFKLIFHYACLYTGLEDHDYVVSPVKINKWKGQLSKKQVEKRVLNITGQTYKGDICDAVGMGLHLKGLL